MSRTETTRRSALAATGGLLAAPGCLGQLTRSDGDESAVEGHLEIVLDDEPVDLTDERFRGGDGPVRIAGAVDAGEGAARWTLEGDGPVTVAEALDGISSLDYERDGWLALGVGVGRFPEREDDTELAFHVNDALVDPEARTLRDGDGLRVEVTTSADASRDAPPGGVDASGPIEILVDGERYDLTRDRFQSEHVEDEALAFHLHDGDGQWYSEGEERVTVGRGVDLLPEISYDRTDGYHRLQLPEATYDEREAGTELAFRVDDALVDPTAWDVVDGESLRVEVATGE